MNETPIPSVALLVVDMQESFLQAIPRADAIRSRCSFAIEAARILNIRTFFTVQVPEKLGPTAPDLTALAGDSPIFSKTGFSALSAPGLMDSLAGNEIDHLILAGVETSICVYQTAIEAANQDMAMTLLSDCIGGRRPEDSPPVLRALAQIGCHILPAEAVFYSVLGGADHPEFKAFTALVKKYNSSLPTVS